MPAAPASPTQSATTDTQGLIRLLTAGAGVSVACIYLNQPLLGLIGHDLNLAPHALGVLPTLTAAGYASGIFFFGPLGDRYDRRLVILWKAVLLTLALIGSCIAPGLPVLAAAGFAIGLAATIAQDFVPSAAAISTDLNRNRNIGTVMTGLLIGIVGSRVFSGIVADHFGWRAAFGVSAAAIVGLALAVRAAHFGVAPATRQPYFTLLRSLGTLFARHPRLRASAFTQACLAVAFSGFWSTVALHLTGTIGLSTGQAGLLGLAGAAGALGASIAGRLSGRVAPGHIVAGGALLMAATFAAMALFPHSLPAIVIGTLLFDVGVQAALVSHQTIIYALAPEARSRINAVFMTIMFIGMSAGAYGASLAWSYAHWTGLMAFCTAASSIGLGLRLAFNARLGTH
ncbi:MFS transporter [Ralstonia pseudosolanacearum]